MERFSVIAPSSMIHMTSLLGFRTDSNVQENYSPLIRVDAVCVVGT